MEWLSNLWEAIDETLRPSYFGEMPLDAWVNWFVRDWLVPNFRPAFRAAQWPVIQVLDAFEALLQAIPFIVMLAIIGVLAWRMAGAGVALFTAIALAILELVRANSSACAARRRSPHWRWWGSMPGPIPIPTA